MQEKTLLKIALIFSLVGIILLFIFSNNVSIKEINIGKINEEDLDTTVKIIGRIEKVSDTEKVIFLTIGQEKIETIPVLLFKDSNISFAPGDYVEITGTLEDYEGEKEVIANKIRLI